MAADDFQPDTSPAQQPPEGIFDGAEKAQRALMARPSRSIRARIMVVFVMLSVLCCGVTIAAVTLLYEFDTKIGFLETVGDFAFEIQQARRFEKNFFLYGTGLAEALENSQMAMSHLERNPAQIQAVIGEQKYQQMVEHLNRYDEFLNRLRQTGGGGDHSEKVEVQDVEVLLRKEGAQLLNDAQEMIRRERMAISVMLHTSIMAAFGLLGFMLFLMAFVGAFITKTVLQPLSRFKQYLDRIGAGDYAPVTPVRKYRDEFSTVALALNQMLTEIVTRQEQCVQSGKMAAVGKLTSGIAHELNNPLNNIGITIEALRDGFDNYGPEEKRRMLDQAYTQVERATGTVRNLLDFTRKGQSAFITVSLRKIVESTVRLTANEAKISGVKWCLELGDELPDIRGNPHDLQQVFLNLFLNSIQAMPHGGEIDVCGRLLEDGYLRVDVKDTGPGIAPEHLKDIFEPFFTTKGPGEGTGLGLSVSQSIVKAHDGRITVESEIGKGTIFSIFLPVAGC